MKKHMVIVGSCNTDMVVNVDHLPAPGETILGGKFLMNPGGKGANQAVAAARLGGDVYFIAKVGNDLFGKRSIEQYQAESIHTDYIQTDPELPSGVALITVDKKGENVISVASGANGALMPEDIEQARGIIEDSELLLMQLEVPIETVEYAARIADEKGKKVILNPAPAQALSDELLSHVYMIVPNETEAELLTGIKVIDAETAQQAADILSEKGVEVVLITLGSKGAFVKEKDRSYVIPSQKVQAVDTTAAGDTFCGALCVGMSEGMSLEQSVRFANQCAAISVTRMGAQSSVPYRKEIK